MAHHRVAAKHGVTMSALNYHLYKTRRPKPAERQLSILPVQLACDGDRQLEIGLGSVRLRFGEGCDPAYVAALVSKLR